mmetsp:Transcript_24143/g.36019  ORF Transcript_24143/g.36019 Transcript_24143/m.36019 type:complete len:200 (+) Transcript_24143:571-1170(+)
MVFRSGCEEKAGSEPENLLFPARILLNLLILERSGNSPDRLLSEHENVSKFIRRENSSGIGPDNRLNRTSRSTRANAFPTPSREVRPVESSKRLVNFPAFSIPLNLKSTGLEKSQSDFKFVKPNISGGGVPTRLFEPSCKEETVPPPLHITPYQSQMSTSSSFQLSWRFHFEPPVVRNKSSKICFSFFFSSETQKELPR